MKTKFIPLALFFFALHAGVGEASLASSSKRLVQYCKLAAKKVRGAHTISCNPITILEEFPMQAPEQTIGQTRGLTLVEKDRVWPKDLSRPGHFAVDREILTRFPGMRFVVIAADGIRMPEIEGLEQIGYDYIGAREEAKAKEEESENVKVWNEQLLAVGINPLKYPPSIAKLIAMAKAQNLRYISPLVNWYNTHSLRFEVCIGGYDREALDDRIAVRRGIKKGKKWKETFFPLGSKNPQTVANGEWVFSGSDENTVVTRNFVNIQASLGALTTETEKLFLISELPDNVSDETAEQLRQTLVEGLETIFSASSVRSHIMSSEDEAVNVDYESDETVSMIYWPFSE